MIEWPRNELHRKVTNLVYGYGTIAETRSPEEFADEILTEVAAWMRHQFAATLNADSIADVIEYTQEEYLNGGED